MSYNKLKSLVANIEAIKTAFQLRREKRKATQEEREILAAPARGLLLFVFIHLSFYEYNVV